MSCGGLCTHLDLKNLTLHKDLPVKTVTTHDTSFQLDMVLCKFMYYRVKNTHPVRITDLTKER